jgi:hypothetical protein
MATTKIEHQGLYQLSLSELESLYRLIDEGIYDGDSTEWIETMAESADYGHEKWEKKLMKREKLLKEIKEFISKKINIILL